MGGTAIEVKSGLNQRNRRFGLFFLHYSQVFTRVEGGIGGPNPPAGALGSPVKSSPNLFSRKKSNFNTRVCFTITFAWLVRAVAHFNNFRNGAERLNNLNERKIRRFQPVSVAAGTLSGLCVKNWAGSEGELTLRQKLPYDCRSAKRFYVRRTALVAHLCHANRWFFITDF